MKLFTILPILALSFICAVGPGRAAAGRDPEAVALPIAGRCGRPIPTSVTLALGLQEVATNGHEVQITREGENLASADVRIARSGFLPSVNASAGHTTLAYPVAGVTTAAVPIVIPPGLVRRADVVGGSGHPRGRAISMPTAPRYSRPSSISGGPSPGTTRAKRPPQRIARHGPGSEPCHPRVRLGLFRPSRSGTTGDRGAAGGGAAQIAPA